MPPSEKTITFASMWFYRVDNGQIVEVWQIDEDVFAKLRAAA